MEYVGSTMLGTFPSFTLGVVCRARRGQFSNVNHNTNQPDHRERHGPLLFSKGFLSPTAWATSQRLHHVEVGVWLESARRAEAGYRLPYAPPGQA